MSNARKINIQGGALKEENETNDTGFPAETLKQIITNSVENQDYNAYETSQVMARLSETCTAFHRFFKAELAERKNTTIQQAKQLLTAVLQGNADEVLRFAQTNPELFFITVEEKMKDYAMDLDGNFREVEGWSAYQAIFGTGDKEMLVAINGYPTEIKKYLDAYLATLSNGTLFANDHLMKKFPKGLLYPKSTYNFDPIVEALTNDEQIIMKGIKRTGKPSAALLAVFAKFRADFKLGVVKTGHHFNINDFVMAYVVYFQNARRWNPDQLSFFSEYVIGFFEGLLTAPYTQRLCQGFRNHDEPLKRSFEVVSRKGGEPGDTISVLPLDPNCRLGDGYFIDSYDGIAYIRATPEGTVPSAYYVDEEMGKDALESYARIIERYYIDVECEYRRETYVRNFMK